MNRLLLITHGLRVISSTVYRIEPWRLRFNKSLYFPFYFPCKNNFRCNYWRVQPMIIFTIIRLSPCISCSENESRASSKHSTNYVVLILNGRWLSFESTVFLDFNCTINPVLKGSSLELSSVCPLQRDEKKTLSSAFCCVGSCQWNSSRVRRL